MHASYADEYINLYIFYSMSLCVYAMHAYYAALYKLVFFFYDSMRLCNMHASYVTNKYLKFHAIYEYMTELYAYVYKTMQLCISMHLKKGIIFIWSHIRPLIRRWAYIYYSKKKQHSCICM